MYFAYLTCPVIITSTSPSSPNPPTITLPNRCRRVSMRSHIAARKAWISAAVVNYYHPGEGEQSPLPSRPFAVLGPRRMTASSRNWAVHSSLYAGESERR